LGRARRILGITEYTIIANPVEIYIQLLGRSRRIAGI
jgi:hypothetical protein